jgi:uncharacterized protein (TIGR00255 family)
VIRSMTGFASVSRELDGDTVHVTLKSVNHRFLDAAIRLPQAFQSLESRLKAVLQQRVARGRVEVHVSAEVTAPPEREVVLDEQLLAQIAAVVDNARGRGIITGTLTASDLLRLPQVLEVRSKPTTPGAGVPVALAGLVELALEDAIDALVGMRETEGRHLAADLAQRLATIACYVDDLEREAKSGQADLETRLRERIGGLSPDLQGDPTAVAQEIVRFVSRSDIDEEVVRLRGHLDHWKALAEAPEPCGRKLDFLVQEMNREINTIGSKVEGTRGGETVIAAKAELERIREQVQNVE